MHLGLSGVVSEGPTPATKSAETSSAHLGITEVIATGDEDEMYDHLLGNPLLPNYDNDLDWYAGSDPSRRHYWQALLLLSVGISLMLGAFVFVGMMLRRCPSNASGAVAGILSSLALVILLVSAKAVEIPKYE